MSEPQTRAKRSHTPGPWRAYKHEPNPWWVVSADGLRGVADIEENGTIIAWNDPKHPRVVEANAHLIAAAPELLALAHQYASECGDCAGTRITPDGNGGDEHCTMCDDIWQIINLAEGRT